MADTWTVLVVDDLPLMRGMLRKFLRDGAVRWQREEPAFPVIRVIEATNGVQGLQSLRKQPVDLIFLDLFMPHVDGLTFLEEKNKVADWSSIPVVVCTSRGDRAAKTQAASLGAEAFIVKPLTSTVVADKLREAVEEREFTD